MGNVTKPSDRITEYGRVAQKEDVAETGVSREMLMT